EHLAVIENLAALFREGFASAGEVVHLPDRPVGEFQADKNIVLQIVHRSLLLYRVHCSDRRAHKVMEHVDEVTSFTDYASDPHFGILRAMVRGSGSGVAREDARCRLLTSPQRFSHRSGEWRESPVITDHQQRFRPAYGRRPGIGVYDVAEFFRSQTERLFDE